MCVVLAHQFFGNMDPAFVQDRRNALEEYFRLIAAMQDLHVHHSLLAFLAYSDVPSNLVKQAKVSPSAPRSSVVGRWVWVRRF